MDFRFIEFNPRRALRGAEAARVAVIEDGEEDWLWMSKRDLDKNIKQFGANTELLKARLAYVNGSDSGLRSAADEYEKAVAIEAAERIQG